MCNVCGQTFGGASNLYHHKKKHHPEEEEAKPSDGFDPEYQNAFSSSNTGDGQKGRPSKIKPKLQPSDPATLPDISQFANRIKQDLQFNNGLNKQDFPNKDLSKIKQDFSNKNNSISPCRIFYHTHSLNVSVAYLIFNESAKLHPFSTRTFRWP